MKKTRAAHLFCSERHAFALSRVFYPQNDEFLLPSHHENNTSRRLASDDQFEQWWESVKIVRCHVPFNESTGTQSHLDRCPICLDEEMVSPFIAPCGHTFCLPCVLGYLNSVAKELNDESDRIHKSKQRVNGSGTAGRVVGSTLASACTTITSVRSRCPMCSSGSSMVLNAGDAVITYKDLRPVVFLPTLAISAAAPVSSSNKSNKQGTQMKFVKLHVAKSCPAPYLPLDGHRLRGASASASTSEQHSLPDLPDGDDNVDECLYSRQYFVGLKEFETVLQRSLNDLNNYREQSLHCKLDPREDWNVSMAIEAVQAAQRRWLGSNSDETGFQGMEAEAKLSATVQGIDLDQTLLSDNETKPEAKSRKNAALLNPGSFYLQQNHESSHKGGVDEFLFYQSADGQPCFLSGINVACLMHEFSLHQPAAAENKVAQELDVPTGNAQEVNVDDNTTASSTQQLIQPPNKPRNTLPLPDDLTGTVLEIEHLTVTNALIKRNPFLSHLPPNSSVSFVEIDWYSGGDRGNKPMLTHSTLSKFRGELNRRKSERLRAAKQEQKADRQMAAKSEKDEQRRRRELLGANYLEGGVQQTINPDDEFFRAPAASFDESEEAAQQWNRTPTFQLNQVVAEGGAWPDLAPSAATNSGPQVAAAAPASPMPSSPGAVTPASPPRVRATSWGNGRKLSPAAPRAAPAQKKVVNDPFPTISGSMHSLTSSRRPKGNSSWGASS